MLMVLVLQIVVMKVFALTTVIHVHLMQVVMVQVSTRWAISHHPKHTNLLNRQAVPPRLKFIAVLITPSLDQFVIVMVTVVSQRKNVTVL